MTPQKKFPVGKTALITRRSCGIGLAIAKALVEAGANCMLSSQSDTADMQKMIAPIQIVSLGYKVM